jgi:hypothetical protein
MTEDGPTCGVNAPGDDQPTCSTGPFGRLTWTLRELASLIGRSDPETDGRGSGDAR